MPTFFPDWVPWWLQLLFLLLVFVLGVAFLLMPFAVFGVKGRLEELELQIGEIQAELRVISMRLGGVAEPRPAHRGQDAAPATRATVTDHGLPPSDGYQPVNSALSASRPTHFEPPAQPIDLTRPSPVRMGTQAAGRVTPWHDAQQNAAVDPQSETSFFNRDYLKGNQPPEEKLKSGGSDFFRADKRDSQSIPAPMRDSLPRQRSEPTLRWPPRD